MQGMAGRKRVRRFPGQGHAAPMTPDGAAVRSFLVDESLENMRQDCGRQRAYEHMRAEAPQRLLGFAGEKPADGRSGDEQMIIRAPCQNPGRSLDRNVGATRNATRDVFINLCGPDADTSHRCNETEGLLTTEGTQNVAKGSYMHLRSWD